MPSGTGLDRFAQRFPDRCFDVGIAEQHAVTFAAGMATEGMKPFCAIYSTFLQRAYDQVVHDVAIQSLPVRFAIDRAGLVGADGATHAGSFDLELSRLPARHRADGAVRRGGAGAHGGDGGRRSATGRARCAIRAARAPASPCRRAARRCRSGAGACCGRAARSRSCRWARGWPTRCGAADDLAARGLPTTVADARFAKPLDTALIEQLARHHEVLVTIEEGSVGGFGSSVLHHLAWRGLLDGGLKVRPMTLPDRFIDHDGHPKQIAAAGLAAGDIVAAVLAALGASSATGAARA